jgi:hypothetical protein
VWHAQSAAMGVVNRADNGRAECLGSSDIEPVAFQCPSLLRSHGHSCALSVPHGESTGGALSLDPSHPIIP